LRVINAFKFRKPFEAGPDVKLFVIATGCDICGILFCPSKRQVRGGIELAAHERRFGNWGFYDD
jgi:hypothetical protein